MIPIADELIILRAKLTFKLSSGDKANNYVKAAEIDRKTKENILYKEQLIHLKMKQKTCLTLSISKESDFTKKTKKTI